MAWVNMRGRDELRAPMWFLFGFLTLSLGRDDNMLETSYAGGSGYLHVTGNHAAVKDFDQRGS